MVAHQHNEIALSKSKGCIYNHVILVNCAAVPPCVRVYGSQGQQRTVALALKLAEAEIFYNKFNEYPILILDDVLSELDKNRQKKLISAVGHMQTIFTATGLDSYTFRGTEYNRIIIDGGKVKKPKQK